MADAVAGRGQVVVTGATIRHADGSRTLKFQADDGRWADVKMGADGAVARVEAGRGRLVRAARLRVGHPFLRVIDLYERSEPPAARVGPLVDAFLRGRSA